MEASPRVRLLPYTGLEDHNQSRRINVELQDPGYYMLCYVGIHIYALNICIHCGRKDHTNAQELPTVNN